VTQSLRTLLLGLTSLAVVVVTVCDLAISVKMRTDTAESHLTENTRRLLAASKPLLLNALVVGDLASAEQTVRNLNAGRVWRLVRLYEPDGRTLIFDASPGHPEGHHVPTWFARLLHFDLSEARAEIAAAPTLYGVLAVVPSTEEVEAALWRETRTMVTFAVVLLATLIVLLHLILVYGLRSVRALRESATRFGAGDLSVRMPESRLAEIAPTVRAFNTMAQNLEGLMARLRANEAANRELAASVEQAEEAILTVDLDRQVTSWNLGARRLFGPSAEAMLGRPVARIFDGEDADADQLASRLIATRPPERLEFALTRVDAAGVVVAAAASQLQDEAGRHTGYIVVARDVTTIKAAEQALQHAKEAAEAANRAKAEFLATMSHEIRTPMNGVLGMNELLLASDLTAEQRECATLVQSSAQALLQVINDILDFSKIEAGRIELETLAFDVRATIGQALKPLALRAHEKGLELVCSVHPDVPAHVVGDPGRLRQVLVNLVGNAVKFTERGEVVVRVDRQVLEGNEVVLHIVVRDTGVGVPAAKRELIFDAFTQADSSTTRRFGGTGLGLAITKRLVQLMHGRIWLESDEGPGSAFHFTARFAVAAAPGPGARAPRPLDGLRVLVVDDNATSRRILGEMLAAWGLRPQVVDGGPAALAALGWATVAGAVPALVITDHEMPDVDGIALAGRMKADVALAEIPIVMLSSSSVPQDQARARQVGVRGFLAKPVTQSELLNAIMSVLSRGLDEVAEPLGEPAPASVATNGHRLRVLVAEDNVVNQRVTAGLLEQRGHRVVVVPNGRSALVALESQPFDLVLMDIEMPEVDGFEATAVVRAYEHEIRSGSRPAPAGSAYAVARAGDARIPIVALTAHAMKGMQERCLAAKMDGYVSKPIQAETLDATLARVAAAASVGPTAAGAAAVDLAAALRTAGGDRALLTDLMRLFLDDCPERVAELRAAVAGGDPDHVQRAAHTVKGSVATFGARLARDLAADLERAGRERRLGDAPGLLGALETELARVSDALRQESVTSTAP
jgi:two-component system sensor histidine kinase/response regulator